MSATCRAGRATVAHAIINLAVPLLALWVALKSTPLPRRPWPPLFSFLRDGSESASTLRCEACGRGGVLCTPACQVSGLVCCSPTPSIHSASLTGSLGEASECPWLQRQWTGAGLAGSWPFHNHPARELASLTSSLPPHACS